MRWTVQATPTHLTKPTSHLRVIETNVSLQSEHRVLVPVAVGTSSTSIFRTLISLIGNVAMLTP